MKLRFVVAALALASSTLAAHAQVGLYFNPVISRVSNSVADSGPFAFLGQNTTSRIFGGVDFGGYYDFLHYEKFDIGADMRDTIQHGDSASLNSFMVGVRVAAKPLAHSLRPYGQLSVGDGRSEAKLNPLHVSKLEYNIIAGVDRPISRHVDWRILEIGYGSLTTISSSTHGVAGQATVPAANLLNFSTGLVFRIH